MNKTDWFSPSVKPVRQGLYEVGSDVLSVKVWWDGGKWIRGNGTELPDQEICWRGLLIESRRGE